jgi:D-threo-aldose 1-dehydrogenase
MLDEAFALGVMHFDVARLYGFGQAESILGDFLQDKRDRVTVTTKFGMEAPQIIAKHRRLVTAARKLSHRFGAIRRLARRIVNSASPRKRFDATAAASSLEQSLRELRTDYVDVFELHEGSPNDAMQPELLSFLERRLSNGQIRSYGIGSSYSKFDQHTALLPNSCAVLQFDSNVLDRHVEQIAAITSRAFVTFNAFRPARALISGANSNPGFARRCADQIGIDISDHALVCGLLLREAACSNCDGITLFATTKLEHLRSNLKHFENFNLAPLQIAEFASCARALLLRAGA